MLLLNVFVILLNTIIVTNGQQYTTSTTTCESIQTNGNSYRDVQTVDECVEAHDALFDDIDPSRVNDNSQNNNSDAPCGCTDHSHGTVDFWGWTDEADSQICSTTAPCTGFRGDPGSGDLACFCVRIDDDSPTEPTASTPTPTTSPIAASEYIFTTDECESIEGYPPQTWRDVESLDECNTAYIATENKEPNTKYDSPNEPWAPCGCTTHAFGNIQFWGEENKSQCDPRVKCTNFRAGDGDLGCLCVRNIPDGGSNFPSASPAPTKSPTESVPLCLQSCPTGDDECKDLDTTIPRFLFAGQSNMVGHSDQNYDGLFEKLVSILNKKKWSKNKKLNKLKEAIGETQESDPVADANEAKFLYQIRKFMKKKKITKPYAKVQCSFTDVSTFRKTQRLHCEKPTSPTACGNGHRQYGPELMFAHAFPTLNSPYKNKKVGVVKVAEGGTRIYNNWSKEMDGIGINNWSVLKGSIHAAKGTIEAFVWFQGENDAFSTNDVANYETRLRTFVEDVRSEIFQAAMDNGLNDKFKNKNSIPVVIVEIGCWLGCENDKGKGIQEAQRAFVKSDKWAMLVATGGIDDPKKKMAKFFHFDSASLLIVGGRIAKVLAKLLNKM